jgi:hypothetical protein
VQPSLHWWRQPLACWFLVARRIRGPRSRTLPLAADRGGTGYFLIPAQKATVRAGQEISVHMTEEPAGPSVSQLVPVFPLPRSSRLSVLADGAISPDRATGTYRAIRPGRAVLISRARCLAGNKEISGSCPIVDVTVLPAASR